MIGGYFKVLSRNKFGGILKTKGGQMDISDKLARAFELQYNVELTNADVYRHTGACAENYAWDGFAKFFFGEEQEELTHAKGFQGFLKDRNRTPKILGHNVQLQEMKEPAEMIALAMATENLNTKGLYALYEMCVAEKDWDAKGFLQPYLTIQRQSESNLFDWQQRLSNCGSKAALFILDEKIGG